MSKKILLVEDDESLMMLESILLTNKGYSVNAVTSGLTACEAIAENPPDLVLLDIMLPGLNGFDVCRRIKGSEKTRHIPVIMLSVKKDQDDIKRGFQVGADDYITKPFKAAHVMETIELHLNKEN